jgi:MerR family copper efflux transcriptional regulator
MHRLPILVDATVDGAPDVAVEPSATPSTASLSSTEANELSEGRRLGQDLMKVGDLAHEAGKTVRAVHLYEQLGLLTPAARSKGGYRLYGAEALVRIRWIGKLQDLGFSLGDIQTIVREAERAASAPSAMKTMRDVYARKLEETRAQRQRLEALEHEIEASLTYLDTCDDVCDSQRLVSACDCCDLHDKEAHVPELILGLRAH